MGLKNPAKFPPNIPPPNKKYHRRASARAQAKQKKLKRSLGFWVTSDFSRSGGQSRRSSCFMLGQGCLRAFYGEQFISTSSGFTMGLCQSPEMSLGDKRAVSSKGGFGERALVPVFVPGEHPPKPPFWKPPFCQHPKGSLGDKRAVSKRVVLANVPSFRFSFRKWVQKFYAAPIGAFFCPEIRAFTGFWGEISSTVSKVLSGHEVQFKHKNGR